jgi:hypothetical protein
MKLSIVIPTYNRNDYLALLLDSIVGVPDEIVVRDNANGAARVLADRYPTVKWLFGPTLPAIGNWRACLDAASSEFVAIPSDDDLYFPSLPSVLMRIADEANRADVVIAGHRNIDAEGRTLGEWAPPRLEVLPPPQGFVRFQTGVPARMISIFFRRDFLTSIGSLDTSFAVTATDSELVQRALLFGRVAFVPEVVAGYRVWPGGSTAQTQMSARWMNDIERWSSKLAPLAAREMARAGLPFDPLRFADELFATNMLAGMGRARVDGRHVEALHFFREMRFPWHATLRTKLRLARVVSRLAMAVARRRLVALKSRPRL